jgi:hypothetical protein
MPCSVVVVYQRFGGTCCLHLLIIIEAGIIFSTLKSVTWDLWTYGQPRMTLSGGSISLHGMLQ